MTPLSAEGKRKSCASPVCLYLTKCAEDSFFHSECCLCFVWASFSSTAKSDIVPWVRRVSLANASLWGWLWLLFTVFGNQVEPPLQEVNVFFSNIQRKILGGDDWLFLQVTKLFAQMVLVIHYSQSSNGFVIFCPWSTVSLCFIMALEH